ncbi:unnamed protein product [Symbiodinium sp. CCMP2592]|nr:unnamed protein product [Symbiodinium sp. CCMP2592]
MAVICEPKFNIGASSIFDADFEACSDEELLERVTQLQAEVRQRALRERRSGRLETRKGVQCAQCGSAGEPTSLELDDDFSALDALALTPWTRTLSALRTPHCRSCGTFRHHLPRGPNSWFHSEHTETISPCVCCRQPVAFDATLCHLVLGLWE